MKSCRNGFGVKRALLYGLDVCDIYIWKLRDSVTLVYSLQTGAPVFNLQTRSLSYTVVLFQ